MSPENRRKGINGKMCCKIGLIFEVMHFRKAKKHFSNAARLGYFKSMKKLMAA